jgi:4-amino-4-deoxychorismate lyase
LLLDYHHDRLVAGCQRLGIPLSVERVDSDLSAALAALDRDYCGVLRLTVTRGPGPRGYTPPETCAPRTVIELSRREDDLARPPPPVRVELARCRLGEQPALAGIKHLNRLDQVMAAAEARARSLDDLILLDQHERVVSVVAGNLFLLRDGGLVTPAITGAGVAGTVRRLIIERLATRLGLSVEEDVIGQSDLLAAQEIFSCNSLTGPRPIAGLGAHSWHAWPVSRALHAAYVEAVSG